MLRTENEVHKEKIDYLEGEIAKKSNTNFEILLENVISILKEEDVHQSIFDTDNDTLKTLYELALSKTLEIKERKKNFVNFTFLQQNYSKPILISLSSWQMRSGLRRYYPTWKAS